MDCSEMVAGARLRLHRKLVNIHNTNISEAELTGIHEVLSLYERMIRSVTRKKYDALKFLMAPIWRVFGAREQQNILGTSTVRDLFIFDSFGTYLKNTSSSQPML